MGLFFIADILGGNKVVLVGSLIQDQMTRGNNWPFAAALAVIMMILTTLMILLYRKVPMRKKWRGWMIKTQNNEIEVLDPKMQGEGAEAKNGTLVKKFGKKRNTGSGMKRSTRFEKIYLGIIFFLMYLPVAVVIIFSFNESKLPVRLTGFSLQWYEKLSQTVP